MSHVIFCMRLFFPIFWIVHFANSLSGGKSCWIYKKEFFFDNRFLPRWHTIDSPYLFFDMNFNKKYIFYYFHPYIMQLRKYRKKGLCLQIFFLHNKLFSFFISFSLSLFFLFSLSTFDFDFYQNLFSSPIGWAISDT